MSYVVHRGLRGAGSAAQTGVAIGSSVGAPIATTAIASTGAVAGALGTLAIPVVGAALAGVTLAITALIRNSGCGPTCIQATQYANQSATLMQQNMTQYFAIPAPRPKSAQALALQNFDALWQKLVQLCSDPALGNAGKRCISERQPGGKYDDAKFNRDPIANDPNVYDDSQTAVSASVPGGPSPVAGLPSNALPWLIAAAAVVAVVALA